MDQEQISVTPEEVIVTAKPQPHPVNQVTTVSKYLALVLFVILPFLGGYVGYTYAPEKVVERVVVQKSEPAEVDPYTPGDVFQAYTVSSIEKSKFNSTVSLIFTDSSSRKLTGTVQAYYSFYTGEYALEFTPNDEYALPSLPGFETPIKLSLANLKGDLTDEINKLCGRNCVPGPGASFEVLDTFDMQNYEWEVVVTPVYINYEYYNAGAGTRGHYITISDIERR